MKNFVLITIILFMALTVKSQWFKPEDMTTVGVYYYPEAWDSTQWNRDFAKMREMGFEFTHMAEFAWAFMEPEEGNYNFEWLDKAVDLAAKNGLKVIMCTPTPAPPAWLVQKYPEVLLVKDDGLTAQHGSRMHYSWSSPKYRELSAGIVTQLAKRYGNDKRIMGWQLDNEPSHYGTIDYSPAVRNSFIAWLKKKYTTIENLNSAWGLAFWSGNFNNFEQIQLPNTKLHPNNTASPHSMLDFKRFSADECASFLTLQYDILKKNILPSQFVTTNFMHFTSEIDPWRSANLDFISYTMYPVAGYTDGVGDEGFRMGDPWRISFANDMYRPLRGTTGVMELQPGQVNWGSYNTQPYPGAVRAWLWNSFAGNLSFICSYRFRQPLYGNEQYHYGMVGTDGITPTSGGAEYSQFMTELKALRKSYNAKAQNPKEYENSRTAILFNFDNYWNTNQNKQNYLWDSEKYTTQMYSSVKSLRVPIDYIAENADFSKYKVLFAPAYQLIDKELLNKWLKYVEDGGNLVLTCRTGQKDRNAHFWQMPWAAPIDTLIGGHIAFYDVLPVNKWGTIKFAGNEFKWNVWADIITPNVGTEVLATYSNYYYAGKAAATYRKLGKGSVTYIGPATNNGKFEQAVLQKVYDKANLKTVVLPEGLIVEYRNGFGVAINYNTNEVLAPIPENAKIIVGQPKLKASEVAVWVE